MASTHFPSKITAIGISKTGDLDVIQEFQLPFPYPTPTQLVIKAPTRRQLPPLPAGLGVEAAGTIVALPTDVALLASSPFRKRGFQLRGKVACVYFGLGAAMLAEYTAADWSATTPLPPSTVSPRVGAASPVHGLTALASEAACVRAGDNVLVHAVAGGLGLWLAQVCRARGAVVIGTTSSAVKAVVARAHGGADHVILCREEDVGARVLEITGGRGVHAIFDGIGRDPFETNLKAIRAKGTIVVLGTVSGRIEAFDPEVLYEKSVKFVYPSATVYVNEPEDGRDYGSELVGLLGSGTVKPLISKEYPFTAEGVREAQKDLGQGRSVWKLPIKVASD